MSVLQDRPVFDGTDRVMAAKTVSSIRPSVEVLRTLKKVTSRRAVKPMIGSSMATLAVIAGVGLLWNVEVRTTEWGDRTDGMMLELALRSMLVTFLIALVSPLFERAGAAAVIEAERPGAAVKVPVKTAVWIGFIQGIIPVALLTAVNVLANLVFGELTGVLSLVFVLMAFIIAAVQQVRLKPAIAYAALGSVTPLKDSRRMLRGRFFGALWRFVVVGLCLLLACIPLMFIPETVVYTTLLLVPVMWGLVPYITGALSAMICLDTEGKMVYPRLKTR